jgi:methylmalonyl-CoA/ethylmalonyl-CoA epimerase
MLTKFGCVFHHIGVACRDLDLEMATWNKLGYEIEGVDFEDPVQRIRGRFLVGPGPRLELLMPTTTDSPVNGYLQGDVKFYHQAFTAPRFDDTVKAMKDLRFKMVVSPVPAVAFEGRRIAFFFMPNMFLVEVIEGKKEGNPGCPVV